jgi:hypothetical protein
MSIPRGAAISTGTSSSSCATSAGSTAARPRSSARTSSSPGRHVGRYSVFGYEGPFPGTTETIPLRSYVVVYGWEGWWVKWRVTTPAPVTAECMREIVDLTESLLPPAESTDPDGESEDQTEPGEAYPASAQKPLEKAGFWILLR